MRSNAETRLFAIITLACSLAAAMPASADSASGNSYAMTNASLVSADLVVRGRVASTSTEMVLAKEHDPTWPFDEDGGYFSILHVELAVDEVLLGYWDDNNITFFVNQSWSDLYGRYAVDDEIVVPLVYDPSFKGGMFALKSAYNRFMRIGSHWVSQGGRRLTLAQIDSIVAPARLKAVTAAASQVVVGTVTRVSEERLIDPDSPGHSSRLWVVELEPEEVLKGSVGGGRIVFRSFVSGSYWPSWVRRGPRKISVGQRYCVFLKVIEGSTFVVEGVNGILAVTPAGRLSRGEQRIPMTVRDIRASAEGQR